MTRLLKQVARSFLLVMTAPSLCMMPLTAYAQFDRPMPDLTPFQLLDIAKQEKLQQEQNPQIDENALTFQTQVLEASGVVLVEFMLPTCAECTPTVKVLKELVAKYKGQVQYLRLNIDKNPGLGEKYDIPRIPAVLVFKDGQFVEKLAVFTPRQKERLAATLEQALASPAASTLAGKVTAPLR